MIVRLILISFTLLVVANMLDQNSCSNASVIEFIKKWWKKLRLRREGHNYYQPGYIPLESHTTQKYSPERLLMKSKYGKNIAEKLQKHDESRREKFLEQSWMESKRKNDESHKNKFLEQYWMGPMHPNQFIRPILDHTKSHKKLPKKLKHLKEKRKRRSKRKHSKSGRSSRSGRSSFSSD